MNPLVTRYLAPGITVAIALVYLASVMVRHDESPGAMQLQRAGQLVVVDNGRMQPLDTVARNSLMVISGRQTFTDERGASQPAIRWLFDVMVTPPIITGRPGPANSHKVFRIENDQVLALLGLQPRSGFRYSIEEMLPGLGKFYVQAERARAIPSRERELYDNKIVELAQHLEVYMSLTAAAIPFLQPALSKEEIEQRREPLMKLIDSAKPLAVPPIAPGEEWRSFVQAYSETVRNGESAPAAKSFAKLLLYYKIGQVREFNEALDEYEKLLENHLPDNIPAARFEAFFNHFAPFYHCIVLDIFVFILACLGWVAFTQPLQRAATALALVALAVHTFALVGRMYIMQRPFVFVTNLYSSAVFIGWICVIVSLVLEWIYKNGIGSAIAAVTGAITLLIGHYLATSGDTLGMMQAVLDTNFWLATHVTTVTIGYSATFVAGLVGIGLIGMGVFTTSLDKNSYKDMGRMIYGVVCFGMLFSFVGTVLGGIWADQSWGRFWGWDPKENGALLIVLWNALILHARWGGMIQQRGMAVLAVLGNIVTAWSWFGVNMLGVGLHSYGFMEGAAFWLVAFVVSQLAIAGAGMLPLRLWASFAPRKPVPAPPPASGNRDRAIELPKIKPGSSRAPYVKSRR